MSDTLSSSASSSGTRNELHSYLVPENEIKRLLYMLPRQENNATTLQFIATQDGLGTSSVVREFAVVSGGDMGIPTLLLSLDDSAARTDDDMARKYYLPRPLLAVPDQTLSTPDWLRLRMVRGSSLTIAMLATDQQKHPIDWATQIQAWRPHFGLILIDAPPLRKSYLGVALASHIDASIIVIGAEETTKSETKDLIYRLEETKGNIIGAIFNKRRSHIPNILYHLPI